MSLSPIKSQYLRAICVLLITFLAVCVSYPAQSKSTSQTYKKEVLDQLFISFYDPRKVRFELIKTSVIKECRDLDSSFIPYPPELKLYAQYKHDTTSIYVLDRDKALSTALFIFRNGICERGYADGALLYVANDSPHSKTGLTDEEVKGLFEDALVRHEKAFGGKAAFLKWLEDTKDWKVGGCKEPADGWCPAPPYDATVQPFVLEILNNYRKSEN